MKGITEALGERVHIGELIIHLALNVEESGVNFLIFVHLIKKQ